MHKRETKKVDGKGTEIPHGLQEFSLNHDNVPQWGDLATCVEVGGTGGGGGRHRRGEGGGRGGGRWWCKEKLVRRVDRGRRHGRKGCKIDEWVGVDVGQNRTGGRQEEEKKGWTLGGHGVNWWSTR